MEGGGKSGLEGKKAEGQGPRELEKQRRKKGDERTEAHEKRETEGRERRRESQGQNKEMQAEEEMKNKEVENTVGAAKE